MKKLILFIVLFQIYSLSAREVVLVSDIDDTLKRTNVLGYFTGGPFFHNDFSGLSTLYNGLVSSSHIEKINYVTGAPSFLSLLGRRFLKVNDFPMGNYHHRESFSDSTLEFKVNKITEVLQKLLGNEEIDVILVGDNGEHDPEAYEIIQHKFANSNLKIHIYIHLVYSYSGDYERIGAPLKEHQLPYLTAVELALDFYKKGFITTDDLQIVFIKVIKDLFSDDLDEIRNVIPTWMRCHDFFSDFERPSTQNIVVVEPLKEYYSKLKEVCEERSQRD